MLIANIFRHCCQFSEIAKIRRAGVRGVSASRRICEDSGEADALALAPGQTPNRSA